MDHHDPSRAEISRADPAAAVRAAAGRAAVIHDAVRRAILEQRLAPGTKLAEDQLGSLFGVSRTLVRAALQRLAHGGIVTVSRNRGASVASPSPEEARQVFDARRVVESVTVARAASRITAAEVADLADLLRHGLGAVEDGDRGTAIRLSGEFHLRIGAGARQPILLEFLAGLVSRSSLVIALYGRGAHSACADDDHTRLLDTLRRHDPAAAVELMTAHLHHIEADLDLRPADRRTSSLAEALRPSLDGVA